MEVLLTITELLRTALAQGAVGFTLRSGLHPLIYAEKGMQTYNTQPSTCEDIEEVVRHLVTSRRCDSIARPECFISGASSRAFRSSAAHDATERRFVLSYAEWPPRRRHTYVAHRTYQE